MLKSSNSKREGVFLKGLPFNVADKYMDLVNILVVALDKNGKIVLLNKAGHKILGYKNGSLIGKNWFDCCLPKKNIKSVKKVFNTLMTGKIKLVENYENPIYCKNGKEKILNWHNLLLRDKKGKIIGTMSAAEDITEKKKIGEELKESEMDYKDLFEKSKDAIFWADLKTGKLVNCNIAATTLIERSKKELIGMNQLKLHPPKLKKEALAIFKKRHTGPIEFEIITKSGKIKFVEITPTLINLKGNFLLQGIFRDITEKKKVEEELQKLAAIPEHSTELINMSDLNGTMVFLNDSGSKMLGIDPKNLGKHNIMEVIPKYLIELVKNELLPTLRRGKVWQGDLQYKNIKTGNLLDVYATTFPIKDPITKKIKYFANASMDITEKKEAEEKLKQVYAELKETDELKSNLTRDVSHNLKTPLSISLIALDLAKKRLKDKKLNMVKIGEYCKIIENNLNVSLGQISAILGLSKLKNVQKFKRKKLNISNLLINVVNTYKPKVKKLKIKLKIEKNLFLFGNKAMIVSLFENLIDNAISFTKKGYIEIILKRENGDIYFSIKDTGVGIKTKNLNNIFFPFYKEDLSTKGTGIGLDSCKKVVKLHGGVINVYSKKGKGTTFEVILPVNGGKL